MAEPFFDQVPPGGIGTALFLNAGDPPLPVLREVLVGLDEAGVDCVELAVPFPDSFTDGPVVRRSADRAMATGVDLAGVLDLLADVRPGLRRLRIALLVDWAGTIRPEPVERFAATIAGSAADALLVHGLPPRLAPAYHTAADALGLPVVATCYAQSTPDTMRTARERATAYLYLVARYGRSGASPAAGFDDLEPAIAALRTGRAPVAVGFGVRTAEDLARLAAAGASAAVIGTAAVERVEAALESAADVTTALVDWITALRGPAPATHTGQPDTSGARR